MACEDYEGVDYLYDNSAALSNLNTVSFIRIDSFSSSALFSLSLLQSRVIRVIGVIRVNRAIRVIRFTRVVRVIRAVE